MNVVGNPRSPPKPSTTASLPTSTGYFILNSATLGLMSSSDPDSTVIASICTPLPSRSSCSLLKLGISAMHGPHHVAQKSTTVTFPLKSADFNLPPETLSRSNSGAGPFGELTAWSDVSPLGRELQPNVAIMSVRAKTSFFIRFLSAKGIQTIAYNRSAMKQRKEFQKLLADKKLKKTTQRALIWGVLLEAKGHPSVEEIRDIVLEKGHRIGLATIYRTLKILLVSGFIRQSKLHGMTRYEPVIKQPNHLHFICNRCCSTVEFPSRKIESLILRVTTEHGFEERYSRYAILGICKACLREERKSADVNERQRLETTVVRDALELTLAIERRGYSFYTNASRKTKNSSGRIMFQRLAAEESDHLRRLQEEYRSLLQKNEWLKREPARLPVSRKIAEDIFPQKALLRVEVKDETNEIDALHIAMNLERRSHQFFKDFASQISETN